jgi:hypothetical protein
LNRRQIKPEYRSAARAYRSEKSFPVLREIIPTRTRPGLFRVAGRMLGKWRAVFCCAEIQGVR